MSLSDAAKTWLLLSTARQFHLLYNRLSHEALAEVPVVKEWKMSTKTDTPNIQLHGVPGDEHPPQTLVATETMLTKTWLAHTHGSEQDTAIRRGLLRQCL